MADVDHDLAVGAHLDVGSVHRTRSRTFEIDSFAVIAAAVAWTLELGFAGLPVGGAAEMCAPGVDNEEALGVADNPDAELLLKIGIYTKREILWEPDLEGIVSAEDCSRKKEAEKH